MSSEKPLQCQAVVEVAVDVVVAEAAVEEDAGGAEDDKCGI